MNFQYLHELLRLELLHRIDRGTLTGTRLARQTGFQQAHISNFLNKKRALSLDGLDRVLASQGLTVDQLLPLDLAASAPPEAASDPVEQVPVVSSSTALHEPRIHPSDVIETLHLSAARLLENRSRLAPGRASWQRFVALRVDAQQASAMAPLLAPGALAILDRHYNSLAPYRPQLPTLFAVRYGNSLLIRYLEFEDGTLLLRPASLSSPLLFLRLASGASPADHIVGRVCTISSDL